MNVYYNEFKPEAAHMLRQLIKDGCIAPGDVDERSITEVKSDDIRKYTQCHFFAGIGGWSVALRLAGWGDDRPVWTGSCPCQPFSAAGKGKAQQDERHLWPVWFRLIAAVRPGVVFGEQVAGAIAHGWLDDAFDDLEREGYQTGAAVLPACSVGAPHKRDRLWFIGSHSPCQRHECGETGNEGGPERETESRRENQGLRKSELSDDRSLQFMADSTSQQNRGLFKSRLSANAGRSREKCRTEPQSERPNWWECEPDVGRVANGILGRASMLHALGNAIVPQVAAEFIKATM